MINNCFYISSRSNIVWNCSQQKILTSNKNHLPTPDLAEAILALEQLLLIRHVYNGFEELGFNQHLWVIYIQSINNIPYVSNVIKSGGCHYTLSFKDELTAKTFRDNFHDLILQAALVL